jgi:hypothetical protein
VEEKQEAPVHKGKCKGTERPLERKYETFVKDFENPVERKEETLWRGRRVKAKPPINLTR